MLKDTVGNRLSEIISKLLASSIVGIVEDDKFRFTDEDDDTRIYTNYKASIRANVKWLSYHIAEIPFGNRMGSEES